jgi:hypothetical protein
MRNVPANASASPMYFSSTMTCEIVVGLKWVGGLWGLASKTKRGRGKRMVKVKSCLVADRNSPFLYLGSGHAAG